MPSPDTRASLLLRIRDPRDRESWDQFVTLYRPVILSLAGKHGMQAADAEDLTQHVLIAVSQAIGRFDPDGERAKFRTWLRTIARRAIINALTRGTRDLGTGGTDMVSLLNEQPAANETTRTLSMDYRREIFHAAADQIRHEFEAETWQAFWDSAVVGKPIDDIAQSLNRSKGSIYTARSRVMARLKAKVQDLDIDDDIDGREPK